MATVKGKGWVGMGGTKAAPFAWPVWRSGRPLWALINYETYAEEGFSQNAWIYGAIMYKVRAMTNAPLRAYKGTRDQPELLDADHPLAKLLDRPNPHQSWTEFHSQSIVYFNIAGECFILFDREKAESGFPSAMYGLRPDRIVIVPLEERKVGYVYVPEGKSAWRNWNFEDRLARFKKGSITPIAPEDIMHVKLPNPLDPLEGMGHGLSPISPSAWATDTDNAATKFLKLFFDRGLMPNVVLKYEAPLDEPTVARVRQRWMDLYGGTEGWLKPGVVDEGGDVQQLGYSFSELGFREIDHRDEARICCIPGTKVMAQDGLRAIEEISVGDYVLTHNGRFRRVLKTFEIPMGNRRPIRIQAKGLDVLEITGNHPVLAARFSQTRTHRGIYKGRAWVRADNLRPKVRNQRGAFNGLCIPQLFPDMARMKIEVSDWLAPSRIGTHVEGDRLCHNNPATKSVPREVPLSPALGRLLGFYLAEGSTGGGKTIWYFHIDEIEYQKQILVDIKEVFGLEGYIQKREEDHVAMVIVQNALVARFFACGTARNKCMPKWAWDSDGDFRHAILMGWMKGDGHNSGVTWRGTTSSEDLAWQMFLLAISVGKKASVTQGYKAPGEINGRGTPGGPYWRVAWRLEEVRQRDGSYNFFDGYWVSRIRLVEKSDYNGLVYNLEVEEDNSYWTTGGVVHNCSPFGVPGALVGTTLGLERATYSNLETLQEWFWEATMVPETLWFEADYRYYLRGEQGEFVQFDFSDVPALQKDIGEQTEAWAKMVDRGVPKNVAAQIIGILMPQLPDGDTVYMPLTMMAVGRMGGGDELEPTPKPGEDDEEGAAGAEGETRALLHVESIAKK